MVRRSIPLSRRLRVWRGPVLLGGTWLAAILACVFLAFLQHPTPSSLAVAVVAQHPVRAPESGRVATISVTPGQLVAAGDLLATVEVPGLSGELAAADAEIVAETGVLEAEGVDRNRKFARDLDAAHAAVTASQVAFERERAELAAATADLARATSPGIALSTQAVADIQARADSLSASVGARKTQLAALESAYASARVRNAQANGQASSARLDVLRARRDALGARAEALTLRATAAGVLTGVLPVPGEWVTAGMPVVAITESRTNEAVIYLDVARAASVTVGETVIVRPSSGPARPAVVRAVGPGVEQLPVRQARDPSIPEYGVPVRVSVAEISLVPGEPVAVDF